MAKISPVLRKIELALGEHMSPRRRSQKLAAFALEKIAEAKAINARGSGRMMPHKQIVDGREGAALISVKPDGVIVARFNLVGEALEWIGEQLLLASPRLTGRYMQSHVLFLDDVAHEPGPIAVEFDEAAFVNTQPYARLIEGDRKTGRKGQSEQAPDGVYEGVAALAARRFGNVARVTFSYRNLPSLPSKNDRQPAIVVRPY